LIAGAATADSVHRAMTLPVLIASMATAMTGLFYFIVIFTLAFATGVVRTLFVAPLLGPVAAVSLEVPVILAASWFVARRLLRGRSFSLAQRAAIGALAFTLTMISEAALSQLIRGQSITEWAAAVATPLGLFGLAAQLGFAAMPVLAGNPQTLRR
jgi:hypothetical protein